ncbi:MAG: FAD-binding oxidoreductase [Candidatus Omnitrophica bacterium]|nr:FAD-binding oxidoreductase [Candidatus Omnitrophota bacterium]
MSLVIPLGSAKIRDDENTLPAPITKRDPSTFENYIHDASNFRGSAESVFIPFSEKQIADFLKEQSSRKIPVTIEGGHTGLTGGGVPGGGVVLSLEKLSHISEIRNNAIRVDSGAVLRDLQDFVQSKKCMYSPDPTERSAFVGGTVATNASGPRTFKYGSTRGHVRKMRVVLSSGDVLSLERGRYLLGADRTVVLESKDGRRIDFQIPTYAMPKTKNAAGYFVKPGMDLIDLFIGSEGTLGVITELELALVSCPEKIFGVIAFFESEDAAIRFVAKARSEQPASVLEYFDSRSLHLLRDKFPKIPQDANAAVFFEQEVAGASEAELLDRWLKLMAKCEALVDQSWVGLDAKRQGEFRDFRHEIGVIINETMARRGMRKVGTDMAVPDEALLPMMKFYRDTIRESGLDSATFGHIGNNHLHVNLLPKSKEEFDQAWILYRKWIERVISLGGTVAAEHGIGKIKVPFLEMMYGPKVIEEMRALKKSIDPAGILGRGTMFAFCHPEPTQQGSG